MESSVKERIKLFIKETKLSTREFERRCGLSNGYINSIEKIIMPNKIEGIIEAFPTLNTAWLLTGQGEMHNKSEEEKGTFTERSLNDGLPLIPFEAVAGWSGMDNAGVSLDRLDRYVVPEFSSKGAEFVVRVSGSSMYPKYSNGDLLACKKIFEILFFQWGKVYVIDSSQGTMVKRIYEDKNNSEYVVCFSDNTDSYPPFSIPKSDIRSLSIVLGVIRME